MRTVEEIKQRFVESRERDFLGFEAGEYLSVLTTEQFKTHFKEFLQPGAESSDEDEEPMTLADVDKRAKDYMSFWLQKIEDERGISVVRATAHFTAWKWLLGHPDADTFPGGINSDSDGGWYQRDAYDYIKQQMDSGEWDRLTAEAGYIALAAPAAPAQEEESNG